MEFGKTEAILSELIKKEKINFIIANGENAAEGMGINSGIFKKLISLGINVITMGNHTWSKKDVFNIIEEKELIRPANYPKDVAGKGYEIYQCNNKKIAVINLIGRVGIEILSENPFLKVKEIIDEIKEKTDIIIIDFHAEATAEKMAMGYFLDGKVTAVFGTHTHIQTADEKILKKGTAYITDIGMTGPKNSIIGMDINTSIKRFLTSLPERYKISEDNQAIFNGCILDINDENNKVKKIKRINI